MADIIVSRPGQSNSAGDARANFLKVFSGEVLTTFEAEAIFRELHQMRTIASGKSAQFPWIGNIGASYHTPGAELAGRQVNHAETVITIDNLLVAQASIYDLDEAMNHYDVRSQYSVELGRALTRLFDCKIARVIARAARSVGVLSGTRYANYGASGAIPSAHGTSARATDLQNGSAGTSASVLTGLLLTAAQKLDEKTVPSADRYVALAPAQYYLLLNTTGGISTSLLNQDVGGGGSIASGTLPEYAGMKIVKTNNMPQLQYSQDSNGDNTGTIGDVTSDTTTATGGNNYNGDFTKTVALVWQKGAVGTVKLKDLSMDSEYLIRNQSTLMLAKYAMGHGVLRPACACEIASADAATGKVLPTA